MAKGEMDNVSDDFPARSSADPAPDVTSMAAMRQRAEAQWHADHQDGLDPLGGLTLRDMDRALHDLQVHQIQLEMQNDELRATQIALQQSRERFFDLYDLAPVGYCSVRETGQILHANLTLTKLLGVARNTLDKQPAFSSFIAAQDQDHWYAVHAELLKSGTPQTCELRLRQHGSAASVAPRTYVWVQISATMHREHPGDPAVLRIAVTDIDLRVQAQAKLQESEDRWKFAIEGAGEGLWDWNVQTGQAFFSHHYKAMLGYDDADIGTAQNEWLDRIHPEDAPGVVKIMQPYLDGKPGTTTVEFRMLRKDGLWQWTLGRGMVVERTAQGKPLRMIGTNTDLTERKHTEMVLRENEARFRTLFESSTDALILNREGKIVLVNAAAVEMLGAKSDEALIGVAILDLIPPEDIPAAQARITEAMATGRPAPNLEKRYIKLDGSVFHAESQAQSLMLDGLPTLLVTLRDITERKQAEAKQLIAANVFAHAREGIMVTSAEGTILEVNEAFTRITGYGREEAIGQNPRFLSSGRHDSNFYSAMWIALTQQGHWSGEVWNRRKTGEVYAELLTTSAVRDAQGNTLQYVALFSDITPIKKHQRELEHIAHFDALTQLPNRLLLADRLQQAMAQAQRHGHQVAVVYLDLDGFKNVNDQHGHEVGDRFLIAQANAMKSSLREGDTLARIGGDEFVIVLPNLDSAESCLPMLTRLLDAASAPAQLGALHLQGSASIGVALYPQAQDVQADQLLRQADHAMYQAKMAGKNRYKIFDAT